MDKMHGIQELLIQKVLGVIDATDDDNINRLIIENAEVKRCWEDIQQFYRQAEMAGLNHRDANMAWSRMQVKVPIPGKSGVFRHRVVGWVAAAAVVIISSSLFYLYHSGPPNTGQHLQPISKVQASIADPIKSTATNVQLQLGNGKIIDLSSSDPRTIQTPGADLRTGQHSLSFTSTNVTIPDWSTVRVPSQRDFHIVLADGSEVWLNSVSELQFPFSFSGHTREVYLSGEAFLKIAKDQNKPFIVHTSQTDIVVHGTSFNVNTYTHTQTVVSLVEGSITAKSKNGDFFNLTPGFEVVVSEGKGWSKHVFDQDNALSWIHGIYYFHDASLADIAQIVQRWFGIQFVFRDSRFGEYTFTGVIDKKKSVSDFLNNLRKTSNLDFSLEGDIIKVGFTANR